LVNIIRNFKSNASQNDSKKDVYGKHAPQAQIFMEKNAPQASLIKQNAQQARFCD